MLPGERGSDAAAAAYLDKCVAIVPRVREDLAACRLDFGRPSRAEAEREFHEALAALQRLLG